MNSRTAGNGPTQAQPQRPAWSGNGMVATLNGTGFMFEVRDRFADAFIRRAGETQEPALEIGCAYGVATLAALQAGARITACDMEPQHLEILRSKVPAHQLQNLELVAGALPGIDFPDSRYTAILCSRVLHFLSGEDILTSVQKMARWLAPGGHLYLVADTPYGIWRKAIPQFEAGKRTGTRWPGLIVGLHDFLATGHPGHEISRPAFMNLLDHELMARTCREAGLEVLEAAFISRPDFGGLGTMDGRENAGVIAIRPA